ncbi:TPA: PrgH/EprH family type III secretion apparatus protein [Providencia rettgeri]
MTDMNNRTYIMKIASGEMCDQEIIITLDSNLIIIGEENNYRTNISDEGFTIYSIPSHQESFTFSIISYEGQIAIDLHTQDQNKIIPINLHEIVLEDLFPFAIKLIDTPWAISPIEKLSSGIAIKAEKREDKFKKSPYQPKLIVGLSLIVVVFISLLFTPYNSEMEKNKKIQLIGNIISGNHHPVVITEGSKREVLILVETQRDFDWSMQRLLKSKYRSHFKINNIYSLEVEIENKISDVIPNLLKVNISDPCNPIIKLLSKTVSKKDEEFINTIFSRYFQCYKKSEFKIEQKNELIKTSELGLTESNVKWHKIISNDKTIYIINDNLNDKQTISLINFVGSFYQQWGDKQIQFSISLENNALAGKSFITNTNGYILLGNNHWLFNSKTR